MKEILISIQPKWCELIASGKKTVEVRKTKPKIETPFKCYIYCTKAKEHFSIGGGVYAANDVLYRLPTGDIKFGDSFELMGNWSGQYNDNNFFNGKVIGEFTCDWIQEYKCEFVDDDCYEYIVSDDYDDDEDPTGTVEWSNDSGIPYVGTEFYKKCCVSYTELKKYMGVGFGTFYGWHISDLVIYEQPKELSEFRKYISFLEDESISELEETGMNNIRLKRPPQSWCYVMKG